MEHIAEVVEALLDAFFDNVFVGDFPALQSSGVAIRLTPGDEPTRYFGGASDNIQRPYITIVARSLSYETAVGWLETVREQLDGYRSGDTLGIILYSTPDYKGKDEQKMHELEVVYKAIVKEGV